MVEREAKIRELVDAIEKAGEEAKATRLSMEDIEDPEEKKKKQKEIQELLIVIGGLSEELKMTRMNKLSSNSFSYTPTGLNRRQKRALLKDKAFRNRMRKQNERDIGNGV